jgi:hypothetical protein
MKQGALALGLLAVSAVLVLAVLVILPNRLDSGRFSSAGLTNSLDRATLEEKRLKSRSDIRTAGAQVLGALALLAGGFLTWRTVRLTREGQLTDRFTNAVEHLGSPKTPVRVGAIYALGRVARDSRTDQAAVMALLAEHLRAEVPWPPPLPNADDEVVESVRLPHPEVRAVALVLRQRPAADAKRFPLDLSDIDLRSAPLKGAHLEGCSFDHANLAGACLDDAHLQLTTFGDAVLEGTSLAGAKLDGADLGSAVKSA